MFIHWDMSSVAGKEISWGRGSTKPLDISGNPAGYVEDKVYDHLYEQFNPVNFNATEWVKLAQESGVKYIVFTAKHHGGFCMWDTKLTDYDIMHTPFKRDVVKELADACHKAGMRFGIYYSPRDWHQPDYGVGDNRKYVDYMNGQLKELLTTYAPVDVLWFDSYGKGDLLTFWHEDETWNLIKSLAPQVLINNRLCILGAYNRQPVPYLGDFYTDEQSLGRYDPVHPWESCMTVQANNGWSYHRDSPCKPAAECLRYLITCATGGGNLLLDVGPNELGEIPTNQADRFREMGLWLKKYGDTIYGTHAGPITNEQDWGGLTYKGNKVYVHAFDWPINGTLRLKRFTKVAGTVAASRVLTVADGEVKATPAGDDLDLTLDPKLALNQLDTIIELTMAQPIASNATK